MVNRFFLFILLHCIGVTAFSQQTITEQEYINTYKSIAVREMLQYGIPASITLAQGMLESGNGNSKLAREAKNHFGIKCHGEWEGPTYHQDDDAKNECFRKYKQAEESYEDHSQFLKTRERYASLFKLDRKNYKAWAKGLKDAGYATNPKYPELLIRIIEQWSLHELDLLDQIPNTPDQTPILSDTPAKTKNEKASIASRQVYIINNIKAIKVKSGDTYEAITQEFGMGNWEIPRYNEFPKEKKPIEGEIIYLQPKRRKSNVGCHSVLSGETIWDIAQHYGIKTKFLLKWNQLDTRQPLQAGQKIKLKKKACKP
ncbi:MAG: glucosaminidase domain-containing protein [Bacteroidia bacterium]|nr:glucosaminidase domain-containing protein [Bacteroidia bacterium]